MKYEIIISSFLLCCSFKNDNQTNDAVINKSLIIGIYSKDKKRPYLSIEKDSILYIESMSRFKYSLKRDSIIIYFDGYESKSKIVLSDKKLNLINKEQNSVFYRIKK